jgi:hemolysin D
MQAHEAPQPRLMARMRSALAARLRARDRYDEFYPGAIEILNSPPSPLGRAVAWTIMAAFALLLLWACLGSVDIVVEARGRIVPVDNSKTVQAPEAAQVSAIHVRDGQQVARGQALIDLNPTETSADQARTENDYLDAALSAARLRALTAALAGRQDAEAAFKPPENAPSAMTQLHRQQLRSAIGQYTTQQAALAASYQEAQANAGAADAELTRLTHTLPLLEEQLETRRGLVEKGYFSKIEFLNLERQAVDARLSIPVQKGRLDQARAALQRIGQERRQSAADASRRTLEELAEAERRVAALEQERIKAGHHSERLRLTAPIAGTVQELAVYSAGAVVTAAQPLLVVVPNDARLELEAQVLNRDIGWVGAGQRVAIKVDAYEFTLYGMASGRVDSVSSDAVTSADPKRTPTLERPPDAYFAARIVLNETALRSPKGARLALRPGMTVTAEINGGKRRVIEYLLSPIAAYAHDSMRER